MPAQSPTISIRLPAELADMLKDIGDLDERTVSAVISRIVRQWLTGHTVVTAVEALRTRLPATPTPVLPVTASPAPPVSAGADQYAPAWRAGQERRGQQYVDITVTKEPDEHRYFHTTVTKADDEPAPPAHAKNGKQSKPTAGAALGSVMTRAEAAARGLDFYNPGHPCKKGHLSAYRTGNGGCLACARSYAKEHTTAKKEPPVTSKRGPRSAEESIVHSEARRDAMSAGVKTYDGKPCVHGHGTRRSVANDQCVACAKQSNAHAVAKREAKRQ